MPYLSFFPLGKEATGNVQNLPSSYKCAFFFIFYFIHKRKSSVSSWPILILYKRNPNQKGMTHLNVIKIHLKGTGKSTISMDDWRNRIECAQRSWKPRSRARGVTELKTFKFQRPRQMIRVRVIPRFQFPNWTFHARILILNRAKD